MGLCTPFCDICWGLARDKLAHAKEGKDGGSRIAVVMNGLPLFTGGAGRTRARFGGISWNGLVLT